MKKAWEVYTRFDGDLTEEQMEQKKMSAVLWLENQIRMYGSQDRDCMTIKPVAIKKDSFWIIGAKTEKSL